MRLYRTAAGRFAGTQADARKDGPGWKPEEVPTVKADLIAYLNALTGNGKAAAAPAPTGKVTDRSYAYQHGRADAERGITTNPYASQELRTEWARGHDDAHELGLTDLPRFGLRTLSRSAPRRAKRKRKDDLTCTAQGCRVNRNRPKGMLG